jgi:hypothetical protein
MATLPKNLSRLVDPALFPSPAALIPPGPRNPAELAVQRLGEAIASFEADLSNEEEVGGVIIGAPGNTTFHIIKFYNLNKDILVFEGINEHGKPQQLVQHVTQLSILLTALPKLNETPRRIGFRFPEPSS